GNRCRLYGVFGIGPAQIPTGNGEAKAAASVGCRCMRGLIKIWRHARGFDTIGRSPAKSPDFGTPRPGPQNWASESCSRSATPTAPDVDVRPDPNDAATHPAPSFQLQR